MKMELVHTHGECLEKCHKYYLKVSCKYCSSTASFWEAQIPLAGILIHVYSTLRPCHPIMTGLTKRENIWPKADDSTGVTESNFLSLGFPLRIQKRVRELIVKAVVEIQRNSRGWGSRWVIFVAQHEKELLDPCWSLSHIAESSVTLLPLN